MYRDNETTTLCPQDGNSLAVLFNLTESAAQAAAVSDGLAGNWDAYGAISTESPDTVSPFIGGFEVRPLSYGVRYFLVLRAEDYGTQVQAHFVAGKDERALDLLRREWGYMLYTPLSVQSTFLEGYTANGSL